VGRGEHRIGAIFVAISDAPRYAPRVRLSSFRARAREIAGEIRKFARYPMNSNRAWFRGTDCENHNRRARARVGVPSGSEK